MRSSIPTEHRSLGSGVLLRQRRARGWELTTVELVAVPEGTDREQVLREQQEADQRGHLGPHTIGLLIEAWSTRRLSGYEQATRMARGTLTSDREKVKTWQVYRLVKGRPVRAASDQPDLNHAIRAYATSRR